MRNIAKILHIFFLALFCLSLTVPTYSYAETVQSTNIKSTNYATQEISVASTAKQVMNNVPDSFKGVIEDPSNIKSWGKLICSLQPLCAAAMAVKDQTDANEIAACNVERFKDRYCGCLACSTVATIISVFLRVAAKGGDVMQQAAETILLIFSALWIAMFLLKQLSSFATIELSTTVQTLFVFLFKILLAWLFINGGFALASHYVLEPIMSFGTDIGQSFLEMADANVGNNAFCNGSGGDNQEESAGTQQAPESGSAAGTDSAPEAQSGTPAPEQATESGSEQVPQTGGLSQQESRILDAEQKCAEATKGLSGNDYTNQFRACMQQSFGSGRQSINDLSTWSQTNKELQSAVNKCQGQNDATSDCVHREAQELANAINSQAGLGSAYKGENELTNTMVDRLLQHGNNSGGQQ